MGFIGVGQRGYTNFVRFMNDPRVEAVAVCDVSAGARSRAVRRAEARRKGCKAYSDFRELLAREDIDAVCISTPEHWHGIQCVHAACAGKDIYCEKPLALTIGEARATVESVERYGRVFQTGSQRRSYPSVRAACERIRSGWIGEVRTVRTRIGTASGLCSLPAEAIPDGLDWDLWVGPAPWRPYSRAIYRGPWRINCRDFGGGFRTDWGSHSLDVVQWALGMDRSGPVEIEPPDLAGRSPLTYIYQSGTKVIDNDSNSIVFEGSEGTIEIGGAGRSKPEGLLEKSLGPDDVRLARTADHRRNFIDCVLSRLRPVADAETGCRSVTACHLGNIAEWLGRPLRWAPAAERFVDDPAADRWLDRAKREPWRL